MSNEIHSESIYVARSKVTESFLHFRILMAKYKVLLRKEMLFGRKNPISLFDSFWIFLKILSHVKLSVNFYLWRKNISNRSPGISHALVFLCFRLLIFSHKEFSRKKTRTFKCEKEKLSKKKYCHFLKKDCRSLNPSLSSIPSPSPKSFPLPSLINK